MKLENMDKAYFLINRYRELENYSKELSRDDRKVYISNEHIKDETGIHRANLHSSILGELESVGKKIEEL